MAATTPPGAPLGGLNLAALAQAAAMETDQRLAGGQANLLAGLQDMLAQQQAGIASQREATGRDHSFTRAQAMLQEALAQREANLQEAHQRARMSFEGREADLARQAEIAQQSGVPDWYAQERFRTDENIRQAQALAQLQAEADAAANTPRLSDFGSAAINPYRGQALLDSKWGKKAKVKVGAKTRGELQPLVDQLGASPDLLMPALRKKLKKHGTKADEIASIALYQLGYLGPQGG